MVGKKIMILAETLQFESGVSTNVFKALNSRARKIVSDSQLTFLANRLGTLGISMNCRLSPPKGPILMDIAMTKSLTVTQLHRLNCTRLNFLYLYWTAEDHGDTSGLRGPSLRVIGSSLRVS